MSTLAIKEKTMRYLLLVCLLLMPTSVRAQSHPCDAMAWADTVVTSGAPYKVQFCALESDKIDAAIGFIDGNPFDLLPVKVLSTPNAQGWILYETSAFIQVAKGNHNLYLATYNRNADGVRQRGDLAGPFGFGAVDATAPPPPIPAPGAPKPKALVR